MAKLFNVTGACNPKIHYMVDLSSRLAAIKSMVDAGNYFSINRGRQYGKTTTLHALEDYLRKDYEVISLDFQTMGTASFKEESAFVTALAGEFLDYGENFPDGIEEQLLSFADGTAKVASLNALFRVIKTWCGKSEKAPVLIIDEVDYASNNQVFLDFLAQLRAYYLKRPRVPAFQSVILAGVYDIRSMKKKIRPDEEHQENSPWNIAAEFDVAMSFEIPDIEAMLAEYENDYHTGMNISELSKLIHDYTSGYPVLVSRLCKLLDERVAGSSEFPSKSAAWTEAGFNEALKRIVKEDNPLYESMLGKLVRYPELKTFLQDLLFNGISIPYAATNPCIKDAAMFGFIRNEKDTAVVSNRIFESVLYNHFISEQFFGNKMYEVGLQEKNRFIIDGHLDIRRILEKFIDAFSEIYGTDDETFLEKEGRRYFLLFLKPIINGIGNYSIEPQTRNSERMDLVIFYRGEQNILELKLWRGNSYNERGEKQLTGYLDYFQMKKGYMLSFNFNKSKQVGIREIALGDKTLIEATV